MIQWLYHHINCEQQKVQHGVDDPWKINIRCQIFCQNQEEHDYLVALNLMHGREIEINVWGDWINLRHILQVNGSRYPRVLPIAYTTWSCNLRGI